MTELELFFLGSPRLLLDGRPLQTDRRKAIALLAYLALEPQAHARESLAALLWPDYDRQSALAYLRRTLWELNNWLGEGWLQTDRQSIQLLHDQTFHLDTAQFQQLLARYRRQLAQNKEQPSLLEEALQLYEADFLSGFILQDSAPFEEWQRQQAAAFQRELRWALSRLVHSLERAAEHEKALPLAHRWLDLDDLNEEAYRALMRLYAALGDRSSAVQQYERCLQHLQEELGIAPQRETVALYEAILSGEIQTVQQSPPAQMSSPDPQRKEAPAKQNLPNPPTPFIGRRPEIEQIINLLSAQKIQLLTLLGPGGSGKTRMAIQAASELTAQFSDGVWFVALAPLQDNLSIVPTIAKALEFSFFSEDQPPRRQLVNYLRDKKLLLVLDNFEHLLDKESIELVQEMLSASRHLHILITSRTRLNVSGEQLYPVSGMKAPALDLIHQWQDPLQEIQSYSSLQLFADRASRIRPNFTINQDNLNTVVQICQLVEGMPLGIELAASWIELLPLQDILSEIKRGLDFLETSVQDLPPRQRSIRAVFDSSWTLLDEEERQTVMNLSIFPGAISRQAAQEVGHASLRNLLSLVNKSWLQPTEDGRYQLHELLRQYALEKLRQDEEKFIQAKSKQLQFYTDLLVDLLPPLIRLGQKEALDQIALEFENIRSAWDWAVRQDEISLLSDKFSLTIVRFSEMRMINSELISMADNALAQLPANKLQIPNLRRAFFIFSLLKIQGLSLGSQYNTAAEISKELFSYLNHDSDLQLLNFWYYLMVLYYGWSGDLQTSREIFAQHLPALKGGSDQWLYANVLLFYAYTFQGTRQYQEAIKIYQDVLPLMQSLGDAYGQAEVYINLGSCEWSLSWKTREPSSAISYLQKGHEIYESIAAEGFQQGHYFRELGELNITNGKIDQAFAYFEQEIELHKSRGNQNLYVNSLHWASMQAVRFKEIEYALSLRLQCQQALQEYDDPEQSAWSNWEMGELLRVTGDTGGAKLYFQEANTYFQQHQDKMGLGYFYRGLGDIALDEGEFTEAKRHFETFLNHVMTTPEDWVMAYAYNGMGRAALGLGELEMAEQHFLRSLHIAYELISVPDLCMLPLTGIADLLNHKGQYREAAALSAFVASHNLTWQETKDQAQKIKQRSQAHLSDEQCRSALEKAQSWQLIEVIERAIKQDFLED